MSNDDSGSGGGSSSGHSFEDPFQELERMFGGGPEPTSQPPAEATEAQATEAEATEEEAIEAGAIEPSAGTPELSAEAIDETSAEPDAAEAQATETAHPESPMEATETDHDTEVSAPAWNGLFEPAATDDTSAASEESGSAERQGPDLEALVAAVDAATQVASFETATETSHLSSSDRGSSRRYIVFSVAGTRYALEMGNVIEVGPVPPVTPLPQVPAWLLGVSNLRGDILAVLDLRRFFGHTPATSGRDRMLVLRAPTSQLTAGLVVDQVHGAGAVDPATIQPPTAPVEGPVQRFLQGVAEHGERLLAILDSERLLAGSELQPFAGGAQISDPGIHNRSETEPADSAGSAPTT